MYKLQTSLGSIKADNPFFLASAPPTASLHSIAQAFELGWGGAVIKTMSLQATETVDPCNRFVVLGKDAYAFENIELLSKIPLENWLADIKQLKAQYPGKVLIGSIMATTNDDWQQITSNLQHTELDALELNFSCPNGVTELGGGQTIGQDAQAIYKITKTVKYMSKLPVFVKLTPNVAHIEQMAQMAKNAGCDGVTAVNTMQSMLGVDLDSFVPYPNVHGKSFYGGMSGRALKPIGLRAVSQISIATKLPIMGVGGITNWQDAVEYILLGASVTQICTAVMLNGMEIIQPMLEGLNKYLRDKQLSSLEQLIGQANQYIVPHSELSRSKMHAYVDPDKCRNCGKCIKICSQSAYQAIRLEGNKATVQANCDGCSLCSKICPFGAIEMR